MAVSSPSQMVNSNKWCSSLWLRHRLKPNSVSKKSIFKASRRAWPRPRNAGRTLTETRNCWRIELLCSSRKRWRPGRRLRRPRNVLPISLISKDVMKKKFKRKYKTCSIRAMSRSTRVRTITCSLSRDKMRREKSRKLSSFHVMKKPNSRRLNVRPMNKLACSTRTRRPRRIAWRTRSSISRRLSPRWKYKRKRSAKWPFPSSINSKKWLRKRLLDVKRKKKSCRWSS